MRITQYAERDKRIVDGDRTNTNSGSAGEPVIQLIGGIVPPAKREGLHQDEFTGGVDAKPIVYLLA